ncbi:MAG TPA: hypothetical protein VGQ76_13425 [Thermoanaerobaculia bacterium]|jgi:hypothetical protein|nr:hypothetical protein [Thermoanaerobaculia bacterium]
MRVSRPTLVRLGRHVAIFAFYAALAVVLTWPLASQLDTTVSDLGDPLLVTWILDWTSHALLHQPLSLFHAPMYYPAPLTLAYSEHLTGIALLLLPLHIAGVPPLTLYNIAMLLGFALSGYGAYVLVRMFTTSMPASLIAGIFFAFVSFKFDHLAHLQNISSGWLPLILAAMIAYWRNPTRRNAALFAGAFVMNGLTNIYYLLFVSVAIAMTVLFLLTAAPKRDRKFWLQAFAALVIAGLVLLPFLLPYRTVSKMYNLKREVHEVVSTGWRAWLVTTNRSFVYGRFGTNEWQITENQLFPGLVAIFLTGAAIVLTPRRGGDDGLRGRRSRWLGVLDALIVILALLAIMSLMTPRFAIPMSGRPLIAIRGPDIPIMLLIVLTMIRLSLRMPTTMGGAEGATLRDVIARSRFPVEAWMAVVWFLVGFVGSFGFRSFLFPFLFKRLTVFQSIRAAPRFAVIAYVALAVFIAIGAAAIISRRKWMAPVMMALMIVDVWPTVQWEHALSQNTPLYRWLAQKKIAPIVELPVDPWYTFRYLLGHTIHRLPTLNGTSGFEPPMHRELHTSWEKREFDRLLQIVEQNGAKLFIVHAHWVPAEHQQPLREFLRNSVASGRLQFVQRFDHGVDGDFVFAVASNFRGEAPPEVPDPAGLMPQQMLERFYRGDSTHTNTTFGVLDQPTWDAVVKGPLTVSGWVLSPHGTRHVWVLLDDGRHRFEATRVPRPDLQARYGWYYDAKPGFTITLPARPKGMPRKTDVQIEAEDGVGRRTRLDDVLFIWE